MKNDDENRNFTISSKVSSRQKARYKLEAKNNNIPLSEWICGTLDMSLNAYQDVNKLSEIKALQEDICEKDKEIERLSSSREILKSHLEAKKNKVLKQAKKISGLENLVHKLQIILDNRIETIYRG
jgi:predicted RNase H-like nuclease (RuvC/YqgF family)